MRCLEHNQKCKKHLFVATIADCEEGNKTAFRSLKDETEQNRINPEFPPVTPRCSKCRKNFESRIFKLVS